MSEDVFVRPVGASLGLRARLLGIVLLLTGIAVAVLGSPVGAQAADNVNVRIMTRNLYLGADLGPAINAATTNDFVDANGQIVRDVDTNNFPVRAKGLAQEILSTSPDLVGLQEVALWRYGPLNDSAPFTCNGTPDEDSPFGCDFTASTVRYDYLRDLLRELNKDKQRYRVVISQKEFDFEAPTDYDNDPNTGVLGGEIQGRLTMRDVILVNEDSKVKAKLKNPQVGTFSSLYTPTVSGIPIKVTRGWTAGDVTVKAGEGNQKLKRKFRFVNSHFEAFDDETQRPSIRAQQAAELVGGPANAGKVILLGDFNSNVPGVQPGDEQAFQTLLDAGFKRKVTSDPLSCCVSDLFNAPPSEFDHQVDHILSNKPNKKVKLLKSSVSGLERVNGIYNSDHAGVFSKLLLK